MARKIQQITKALSVTFYWRPHEYGGENRVRVWRDTWTGDQFEVLSQEEFTALQKFCDKFGMLLREAEDD